MPNITVGFPATLSYYLQYPMWRVFFTELGCKFTISPSTNKNILDEGVKETVTDACVPIKLFHGHVVALKNKVDFLFIPRLVNVDHDKNTTFCPKFLGLPDMIRASIPNLPKIISPEINRRIGPHYLLKACREIGAQLEKPVFCVLRAYRKATAVQRHFERIMVEKSLSPVEGIDYLFNGYVAPHKDDADLNIAVIGYPYQVFDSYVSADLVVKLKDNGVRVFTAEMVPYSKLEGYAVRLKKRLFWHLSNKVVWACYHYLEQPNIDGIVHVTAFGCGPDSMVDKLVELECKKRNFPFLSLMIDEQTGEGGIATRLEAFTDMIRLRRAQQ